MSITIAHHNPKASKVDVYDDFFTVEFGDFNQETKVFFSMSNLTLADYYDIMSAAQTLANAINGANK